MAGRALPTLRAVIDGVGVAAFATVFLAINFQVFMRYVVAEPVSWSEEFPTLAFTIAVLWAASLMLKAGDHIVFELVADALPLPVRRVVTTGAALLVAALFALSLPAILDFAAYMKVLSSPILRVRYDFVYFFFAFFVAAIVVRALIDAVLAWRAPAPDA